MLSETMVGAPSGAEFKKIMRETATSLRGRMPKKDDLAKEADQTDDDAIPIDDTDLLAYDELDYKPSDLAGMSLEELHALDAAELKKHIEAVKETERILDERLRRQMADKEELMKNSDGYTAESKKLSYISGLLRLWRQEELSKHRPPITIGNNIQARETRRGTAVNKTHQIREIEPDKEKRLQEIEREINTFGKTFKKRYAELLNQDTPKFKNKQEENNYKALDLLLTEKNLLSEQVYPTVTTGYKGGTRVEIETNGSGMAPTSRLTMDAKTLSEIKGPLKQIQPGEQVVIGRNKYGDEETIMAVKDKKQAIQHFFGEKEARDLIELRDITEPTELVEAILDEMEKNNVLTEIDSDALMGRLNLSEAQWRSVYNFLNGLIEKDEYSELDELLYKSVKKYLAPRPQAPAIMPTPFRLGGVKPAIEQKRAPVNIPTPPKLDGTKLKKRPWWKKVATGVAAAAVAAGIYAKDRANDEAWPDDVIQPVKISGPEKAGLSPTWTKSIETKTSLPPPTKPTTAVEPSPQPNIRTQETKPMAGTALPKPPSVQRRPLTLHGIRQPERRAIAPKSMTAADKAKWDRINRGWNDFTHRGSAELDKEGGTFASVPSLTTPRSGPKGRPEPPGKKGLRLDIRERSSRLP